MHRDPALIGHRTVTAEAVAAFAGLTGDYARIHLDHAMGKALPGGRGFAHGLLSASWALGALTLQAPERVGAGDGRAILAGFEVRFHDVVRFGDTLALRCEDGDGEGPGPGFERRCTRFSMLADDGRLVTSGSTELHVLAPGTPANPLPSAREVEDLWPGGAVQTGDGPEIWTAEDLVENGPRGATPIRTITEADVTAFTGFTGELNPLYLHAPFAERALFGTRTVPPMLGFCLGFAAWLRELLRLPMGGGESTAGHLGDRWRLAAPVHTGDTLEVRHRPLRLRRTRSQPTRGIVTFGLQLVNQRDEVVQQGEVDMMLGVKT
jgi:acyl dehydratase